MKTAVYMSKNGTKLKLLEVTPSTYIIYEDGFLFKGYDTKLPNPFSFKFCTLDEVKDFLKKHEYLGEL